MEFITDISEIDPEKLKRFVRRHPYGNFFQSTKALQFFQSLENFTPILIVALDDDKVVGSLLSVVIRENGGLKGYLSRRCIVWGGPLVINDNPDVWDGLLSKFSELASKMAIYSEFRNFRDLSTKIKVFENHGYQLKEHLNFIVSVTSLEQARAGLSKSKKRQINKSLKCGAEIVCPEKIEDIESFYKILSALYKEKVKKPLAPFSFFRKFFQDPSLGTYLLVKYEGDIIGGIMCPIFKDTIYEWFVCGKDGEIIDVYPSVLATWAPIEYAANNGIKYFDFMGAGSPDMEYGVRNFKAKFGGEAVNFGRFVKVNQRLQYQVGKMGLELLKRFK